MLKIQIKNRFTDSIIFEYEKENNTISETVKEYIRREIEDGKISADLRSADLRSADLRSADLSSADLRSANLSSADLRSANLSSADLRSADLRSADLRSADLRSADLSSADLRSADLSSADLRSADLSSANLRSADLRSADLSSADLRSADLRSANLRSALNIDYALAVTRVCPDGDIIGWKKCRDGVIVKLLIPKEAKRNNAFGRKCRAEYADVLEVIGAERGVSKHDDRVIYEVGKRVIPLEPFDDDFKNECSTGIHFFITKFEAEKY